MREGIKWKFSLHELGTMLEFSGSMTEDFDQEKCELPSLDKRLIIDLSSVSSINSCGIREWIKFLERIPGGIHVVYIKVPSFIVSQFNMVNGFITPDTDVASLYLPYYNPETDEEISKLVRIDDVENGKAPIFRAYPKTSASLNAMMAKTKWHSAS